MHAMQLDRFNTARPWDATARAWDQRQPVPDWMLKFVSHYAVHVLDPQTLAYALADSPVGTLAWLLERWRNWGDGHGDPQRVYTRAHMITSAMLYWATGTIGSSLRAYADAARHPCQPRGLLKGNVSVTKQKYFVGYSVVNFRLLLTDCF
jgi:microsomal epoxide hydrolase